MENKNHQENEKLNFSQTKLQQLEQKHLSLIEEVRLAALNGDFKENFDWTATLQEIKKLKKEISLLQQKIRITKQGGLRNKTVTYQLLETKRIETVQLIDFFLEEREINSSPSKTMSFRQVSFTSPLGLVLDNKKIGETGKVETKKKSYWVKIINIEEK